MTIHDVEVAVEAIKARRFDDESAHGMEDSLHADVLDAIAKGEAEDPAAMAALALTTAEIQFARWCA